MRLVVRLSVLVGLLLGTSCAPDLSDPDRFQGDDVCDVDIQRDIMVPRCATLGCHAPFEGAAEGLEYFSGGIDERLVGVPAVTCPSHYLIDPVNPDQSYLLTLINEDPSCDGRVTDVNRMPLNFAALSEHDIMCITRWVYSFEGREVQAPLGASDAGVAMPDGGP